MTALTTASRRSAKSGAGAGAGFVLIEVLVSLTVFSVGIMAVLVAVLAALDLQKDSALRYRAGLVLEEKLAETVLVPYDGKPMQGISADGLFSWSVTGETWTGAPQLIAGSSKNTKQPKRTDNRKKVKDEQKDDAVDVSSRLLRVAVDVSWRTGDETRSISAVQLVHVSPQARGTP